MEYTDMERRILDMWPKFEDGKYVMYEDEFDFDGEVKTAYGFNFGVGGRVSICSDKGSHVRLPNGERVKRPAPKVLDADGVEVHLGDTVYESNGQSGIVIAVHPSTRCVDLRQDGCVACAMDAKRLTHTRPDSWERLEEDIAKQPCLIAEEVKGSKFDSCSECPWPSEVIARNIVRRAKALAEKEVGQ